MSDIRELWSEIQSHPDYCGGTVFTREDVADVLFEPEDGWDDGPTPDDVARVTDAMQSQAIDAIDAYVFAGAWTWRDALREVVDLPEDSVALVEP